MSDPETTLSGTPNYDPIALTESFASAAEKSAKLLGDFLARQAAGGHSLVADEFGLTKAFLEVAAKMLSNPYRLAETLAVVDAQAHGPVAGAGRRACKKRQAISP